jgi:hypothetical protein
VATETQAAEYPEDEKTVRLAPQDDWPDAGDEKGVQRDDGVGGVRFWKHMDLMSPCCGIDNRGSQRG